ncbi:response regulator transcription factor [Bacillus massiliigorillae]|uniref:response regulator transcription factor n=1 Tax=Bacillus massiliigorillae TaxID=1243664 RepID=UPI0003A1B384|nr:response regulator transcription factor [Bacillus massiliigorillae]
MQTIMIVEDDQMLNTGITFNMQMDGFEVISASTIQGATEQLNNTEIHLIILDVNLPDGSGFDFCKKVRERYTMPILFLTACDMELDVITGFRIGGDDYITKPFSLNILRERVFALLRRSYNHVNKVDVIRQDGFEMNLDSMTVQKDGESLALTPSEYKLMKTLMERKGEVITRQKLLEVLFENDEFVEEHTLTVTINRLRNKIEDEPSKPNYVKTVYGMGYTWAGDCH